MIEPKKLTIDRNSLPAYFLDRDDCIGIELGVAKGKRKAALDSFA